MLMPTRATTLLLALGASPALACPDPTAEPYLGEMTLNIAYELDPYTMAVRGGGITNLRICGLEGEGLTGYDGDGLISVQPDVVLHVQGGFRRLAVTTEIEDDTLLIIHDPEGGWHFNDNGRDHNPLVAFDDVVPGDYIVWIGSYDDTSATRPGMLIVTQEGP